MPSCPPLLPLAAAFVAGLAAAEAWHPPLGITVALAVIMWIGAAATSRWPRSSRLTLLAVWIAIGALRGTIDAQRAADDVAHVPPEVPSIAVRGRVRADPTLWLDPGEPARAVMILDVEAVRLAEGWRAASGGVRVRMAQPRSPPALGERWLVAGQWSAPAPPGNPGQYDWRAMLARQGIHRLLDVRAWDAAIRVEEGQARRFQPIRALRRRWEALARAHLSEPHAGMLLALVLGQKVALSPELQRAFIETGTMHLVVVSGFNVGLLAVLLDGALRLTGLGPRARPIISAAGLGVYALMTGLQPPIARATLMAWIALAARWWDRDVDWPNTLAAAALVMLALTPSQLREPSFQLSFGAVGSLILLTPKLTWQPRLRWGWLAQGLSWLSGVIAATIAVWLGLWPVLVGAFHLLTPVSLLSNIVLTPIVSAAVALGVLALSAASVCAVLMAWIAPVLTWLVAWLIDGVHACHRIPAGCFAVAGAGWPVALAYYALLGVTLERRPLGLGRGPMLVAWLIALNACAWPLVVRAWRPRLEMLILDVGHGDALAMRTPQGQRLLIDAGTEDAGRSIVVPALRSLGWNHLDALILTHPDEDHVGGALPVLETFRVRRLLSNGTLAMGSTGRRVLQIAERRGLREERLSAGMRVDGLGVEMEVLHPPPGFVPEVELRSNDNSLVLRVRGREVSTLLCADLEERGLAWVLARGDALRTQLLKVPHHGSSLGHRAEEFFRAVAPDVAIISVGRKHGLPAADTVRILRQAAPRLLLTREAGALRILDDAQDPVRSVRPR